MMMMTMIRSAADNLMADLIVSHRVFLVVDIMPVFGCDKTPVNCFTKGTLCYLFVYIFCNRNLCN